MSAVIEIVIAATLVIGAVFTLVGSYGLVKLASPMSRLHAPTKAGTLGVGSILLASSIHSFADGRGSVHELLVLVFLFITAPVSAHFLAKVTIHRNRIVQELPPAGQDSDWATRSVMKQDADA